MGISMGMTVYVRLRGCWRMNRGVGMIVWQGMGVRSLS